jgi:hypothetical protein
MFINSIMDNIDKCLQIFETHSLGTFDEVDNLSAQSFDVPLNYKQPDINPKAKKKKFKKKNIWRKV